MMGFGYNGVGYETERSCFEKNYEVSALTPSLIIAVRPIAVQIKSRFFGAVPLIILRTSSLPWQVG